MTVGTPPMTPPAGSEVAEVDSVLTTVEVAELLQQEGADLAALPEAPLPGATLALDPDGDGRLRGYPGGAGGYLEHVFRCTGTKAARC